MTGHADVRAVRALLRRPDLTVERERHLLRTRRNSSDEDKRQQALSELWEGHRKLVVALARQYQRQGVAMTELVGAGHLGMQAAIEGYDPDRLDTRLSAYAVAWIRHYIQDYIGRHAYPARPPASAAHRHLVRCAGRLFAEARRSCEREGVPPTEAELCVRVGARIGLAADEVAKCLCLAREGAPEPADPGNVADVAPQDAQHAAAPGTPAGETEILHLDHAKLRRRVMDLTTEILGERERKVFLARCVVGAGRARHHTSLAAELGVTRERICQIEASARRKIATALSHEGLLDPDDGPVEVFKGRAPRRPARRTTEASV